MSNPVADALAISSTSRELHPRIGYEKWPTQIAADHEIAPAIQRESLRGKTCGQVVAKPGHKRTTTVAKKTVPPAPVCISQGLYNFLSTAPREFINNIRVLLFGFFKVKFNNLSTLSTMTITTIISFNNKQLAKKALA